MTRGKRWVCRGLLVAVGIAAAGLYYVRTHPLVFMPTHVHCIRCSGLALLTYAEAHDGRYPTNPRGYGNALLLLDPIFFETLTGPGYSAAPFHEALRAGTDLAEEDCGRVYVQGLTRKSHPNIAMLFDKLPTPGGDHCALPWRLWAPLGREVWYVSAYREFISEANWPEFAKQQIDLLVAEGFDRQEAERLYASQAKGLK